MKDIIAGMLRVEAFNEEQRQLHGWKPVHKPSLGPYTAENPKRCENCGKPAPFDTMEECPDPGHPAKKGEA